jgi:hypothetical protein
MKSIKPYLIYIIIAFIILIAAYYFLLKPAKVTESKFGPESDENENNNIDVTNDGLKTIPIMSDIRYNIEALGRDKVFPFTIVKRTPEVIELPFRLSLVQKDFPYKFIDANKGDELIIVNLKAFTYTINGQILMDTFFVTDNDYLIAYSQAYKNFGIK